MVRNGGTTARSLKGWTVRDAANHVYTFGIFTLGAGKSVVLRTGKGTNTGTTRYWGLGWHVWNNTGDTAYLRNSAGTAMDTCRWTSSRPRIQEAADALRPRKDSTKALSVPDGTMAEVGRGMALGQAGERDAARHVFEVVWNEIGGEGGDPLHRCAVAHARADIQADPSR